LRFFRERRLTPAFVDLAARPIAPAELRRFSERYGAAALLDTDSRGYRQAGHGYLSLDEQGIFARLLADQSLLRLPLVRAGRRLTIGRDEGAWQAMVAPAGQAGGIG
jgi:arsenate reductase